MKKLFCILLAATFALTTSLYAQEKDNDAKDKAETPAKDKAETPKDKAETPKDKEAPKDKDAKVVVGVKEEQFVELFGQRFAYIDVAGRQISPITLWGTLVAIIAVVGVWFFLLRKGSQEGENPQV